MSRMDMLTPIAGDLALSDRRHSSAGFAGAILSWGEVRKGGGAPLRDSSAGFAGAILSGGEVRKGGGAPLRG
jgi:hypothetical protein